LLRAGFVARGAALAHSPDPEAKVILVVDDDPDIARVIRLALESEGLAVVTAPNGRDALQRVREQRPELVLLDINMPIMDGVTFVHRARDEFGDLPIIVMTAGAEASRYRDQLGARDSLPKPFELNDLLDKVERYTAP
jgi:two-component system KDP operon response regulator KdpE